MAGDWIKMRTDLYRDPKVCMMADCLMAEDGELANYVSGQCRCDMAVTRNVMRNVTVGALVTVWGVTRHRGKRVNDDLFIRGATLSVIDDIADLPGFGAAMEAVGWAQDTEEGLVFPRFFEEFNVEPCTDQKEKNAERQRRFREKRNALRNVTVTSQSNAREENNRDMTSDVGVGVDVSEIIPSEEDKPTIQDWCNKVREVVETSSDPSQKRKDASLIVKSVILCLHREDMKPIESVLESLRRRIASNSVKNRRAFFQEAMKEQFGNKGLNFLQQMKRVVEPEWLKLKPMAVEVRSA